MSQYQAGKLVVEGDPGAPIPITERTSTTSNTYTDSVDSNGIDIVPANLTRIFVILQNLGSVLYVKLGTGAALNSYSFQLAPLQMVSIDRWDGVISAVRNGMTDDVIITEVS